MDSLSANLTDCTLEGCFKNESAGPAHVFFGQLSINVFHTLYVLVLLIGFAGNILTAAVILTRHTIRRAIYLYTFNLVVCDMLILCFYVPTQMTSIKDQLEWKMGEKLCKVANIVISVSITCTIGTLLAITFDRARGMINPFKWRADLLRKAKIKLLFIWVLSLLINFPLLIYPKLQAEGSSVYCVDGWPEENDGKIFWMSIFVLVFVIPLLIIVITYVLVICILKKTRNYRENAYDKRMIRMGVSLVVVFFVCTGFQHIFYVIYTYGNISLGEKTIGLLYGASNFFVSLQAALNPFLYCNIHQDMYRTIKNKIKTILAIHDNMHVAQDQFAGGSTYVLVKARFNNGDHELKYGSQQFDTIVVKDEAGPSVNIKLNVSRGNLNRYSQDFNLQQGFLHQRKKYLSVGDDIFKGYGDLIETRPKKTRSLIIDLCLISIDNLENSLETTL